MKAMTILIAVSLLLGASLGNLALADQGNSSRVEEYLNGIISRTELMSHAGEHAIITIDRDGTLVREATVSANGATGFARELHRRIDWKSFPQSGTASEVYIVSLHNDGRIVVASR